MFSNLEGGWIACSLFFSSFSSSSSSSPFALGLGWTGYAMK